VPRLTIVIPAYNEADRLPGSLTRLHRYLESQSYSWEVIVVSNGSTDATEGAVRIAAQGMPGLRLLTEAKRGKGIACRAGALQAKGDIIFLCDADLSMPPETMGQFMTAIESVDIVVGSREAPGAQRYSEPWHRHLMGRIFNYLVQLLAISGIKDTQCGFKAFRRHVARHLFSQQHVNGFGFDVELLFLARKFGYSIHELGIDWYFDTDSRVRPGMDTFNMVAEVCMIRLRSAVGRYGGSATTASTGGEVGR
jgi:dolichyl-phosphate beta-glucosyltransferase